MAKQGKQSLPLSSLSQEGIFLLLPFSPAPIFTHHLLLVLASSFEGKKGVFAPLSGRLFFVDLVESFH